MKLLLIQIFQFVHTLLDYFKRTRMRLYKKIERIFRIFVPFDIVYYLSTYVCVYVYISILKIMR